MAELRGLSVKVPIKFSEKAQRDLYETCMAYKKLAEMRGAENEKLRKLVRDMMDFFEDGDWCVKCERALDCQEQEQYEDECLMRFVFRDRMRELGAEVIDG